MSVRLYIVARHSTHSSVHMAAPLYIVGIHSTHSSMQRTSPPLLTRLLQRTHKIPEASLPVFSVFAAERRPARLVQ